jgi:hypothetical protein
MVCDVLGFNTLSWCWYRCREIETSSIDWVQLSRFYLNTEAESSLLNVTFWMDNVQKHNICINVPSSQTVRSYLHSHEHNALTFWAHISHVSTRLGEFHLLQACNIFHLFVLHDRLMHRPQVAVCSTDLSELMAPDILWDFRGKRSSQLSGVVGK